MFISELMPVADVMDILSKHQVVTDTEFIDLVDAYQRVNVEEILTLHNSPPFDKSAMDGYAIVASDSFSASNNNPISLEIVDYIGAGSFSEKKVESGMAIGIATGAPIPEGADAVIMKEYTIPTDNGIEIVSTVSPGENIAVLGEDVKKGDLILSENTFIRSQEMAMVALSGYSQIEVYRKPKVLVINTGNELVNPCEDLPPAKIINSNRYALKGKVESCLADVTLKHCVDDEDIFKNLLLESVKEFDVIITTGGTAVSKGDVVVRMVEELGEVLVHGIAARPGKPFAFGMVEDTPIFMLSGYPAAAFVLFDIFVRPFIFKMQHIDYNHKLVKRISNRKIPSGLGRTDYIRAFVENGVVTPKLARGSTIIRTLMSANAYIVIEENREGVFEDETCDVLMFDSLRP